jgi:hypothetical protein
MIGRATWPYVPATIAAILAAVLDELLGQPLTAYKLFLTVFSWSLVVFTVIPGVPVQQERHVSARVWALAVSCLLAATLWVWLGRP